MKLPTLDSLDVTGKTVLLRVDLNVPMQGSTVTDTTRIDRLKPTLQHLVNKKARVVLLSHFGRPKGTFVPYMSLAPLVDAVAAAMDGMEVKFGVDCVGPAAHEAVQKVPHGGIILLENLRFHAEEEKNDPAFSRELASLGDIYVNDAFSCSHRAHASVVGITEHLPSVAGQLVEREVDMLEGIFSDNAKPITAIIGGSKISTKLELLENLIDKMEHIVIGGAMANTFLLAQGYSVGKSLVEPDMKNAASRILKKAGQKIILPVDVVTAHDMEWKGNCGVSNVENIPQDVMVVDIGYKTLENVVAKIKNAKTIVWNGPVGLFEVGPFDTSSIYLARVIAYLTKDKKARSIAGGGDTLAAIAQSGLSEQFTYLSTAGGAFLEWLEGKTLPGIAALLEHNTKRRLVNA